MIEKWVLFHTAIDVEMLTHFFMVQKPQFASPDPLSTLRHPSVPLGADVCGLASGFWQGPADESHGRTPFPRIPLLTLQSGDPPHTPSPRPGDGSSLSPPV